jgi:hypothetical protein
LEKHAKERREVWTREQGKGKRTEEPKDERKGRREPKDERKGRRDGGAKKIRKGERDGEGGAATTIIVSSSRACG